MSEEYKTIEEKIFDFIYDMALNDATKRVSKSGDKEKIARNAKIKEAVREYAENIICGESPCFRVVVNKIKNFNEREDDKDRVKDLTFGKIQKLLNMTMKYLYILYYNDKNILKNFTNCHAPMDSIMRDFVYWSYRNIRNQKPGFSKECAWSQIDEDNAQKNTISEYEAFQETVDSLCDKRISSKIEFDYIFWNDAKELVGMNNEKQKEMVDKIWKEYGNNPQ